MYSLRIFVLLATLFTAVSAVYDVRTSRIPNWLTALGMLVAVAAHTGLAYATGALPFAMHAIGTTLLGAAVCALVPLLMWCAGLVGGGDVKLIAVVGALCHAAIGMEAVFLGLCLCSMFVVLKLAWEGDLLKSLFSAVRVLANPILPAERKTEMVPSARQPVRFGPALAIGTILTALAHGVVA